jgi:hypothetical protein
MWFLIGWKMPFGCIIVSKYPQVSAFIGYCPRRIVKICHLLVVKRLRSHRYSPQCRKASLLIDPKWILIDRNRQFWLYQRHHRQFQDSNEIFSGLISLYKIASAPIYVRMHLTITLLAMNNAAVSCMWRMAWASVLLLHHIQNCTFCNGTM